MNESVGPQFTENTHYITLDRYRKREIGLHSEELTGNIYVYAQIRIYRIDMTISLLDFIDRLLHDDDIYGTPKQFYKGNIIMRI